MSVTIPIESAERDLRSLLEQLQAGETAVLVDPEGVPEALLVSLKSADAKEQPLTNWEQRWDALAHQVSEAWESEQSALEVLAEMRR